MRKRETFLILLFHSLFCKKNKLKKSCSLYLMYSMSTIDDVDGVRNLTRKLCISITFCLRCEKVCENQKLRLPSVFECWYLKDLKKHKPVHTIRLHNKYVNWNIILQVHLWKAQKFNVYSQYVVQEELCFRTSSRMFLG